MLLYSILLCVERCGLIALWAKLVFLHLGERSELGANVAPCGFLDGITIADRLRLRDFNGIILGDSQQTLFNMTTWEIYMFVHPYKNNSTITITLLDLQQKCCFPSESCVFLVLCCFAKSAERKERFLKLIFSLLFNVQIIFSNCWFMLFFKKNKMTVNSRQKIQISFLELKVMSSDCLFCPTKSPKPKNISIRSYRTEKSSKFSHLRSWNQRMFGILSWKVTQSGYSITKMVANSFCDDRLMVINRLIVLALDQCPHVFAKMTVRSILLQLLWFICYNKWVGLWRNSTYSSNGGWITIDLPSPLHIFIISPLNKMSLVGWNPQTFQEYICTTQLLSAIIQCRGATLWWDFIQYCDSLRWGTCCTHHRAAQCCEPATVHNCRLCWLLRGRLHKHTQRGRKELP